MKKLIIILLFPIFCYSQNTETSIYNTWDFDITSNYCCEKCKEGEHSFVQSDTIVLGFDELATICENITRYTDYNKLRIISIKYYTIMSICRYCCQEHTKRNAVIIRKCNTLYDVIKNKSDDAKLKNKLGYKLLNKEYSVSIKELK